ncbi:hypothetical protein [Spirillospora sp. NPDC047279]|uniref:hypothetical protein n=1 Tax=Spirillospora sp. NPDC047279 TaxID=3155478 RepID=UPI0033D8921A
MPSPSPVPPPHPDDARSWPEFTARLRELHAWCGSPKYRALCSRTTGLSPAAVSTLIGKNPLSQPPETAAQRFVLACLTYRDLPAASDGRTPPFDAHAELARWKDRWRSLSSAAVPEDRPVRIPEQQVHLSGVPENDRTTRAERAADPPSASAPAPAPGLLPARAEGHEATFRTERSSRRSRLPVAIVSATATAAVFLLAGFLTEETPDPDKECLYVRGTIPDARLDLRWSGFYQCPDKVGAAVYATDAPDHVIGYVDTDPGRLMCWTRGRKHSGSDIWYYTRADRSVARPELRGWGFIHADDVQTDEHPATHVTRECAFL